ncbi:NIPSNAP family protein [Pseudonocardia xishanensis]|uniref:NIPSNAP family protein n=1 Tax=Pseudonocardia xishanensis TaxID=630995 RepID=A0ABP8RUW2_9PSEU
MVIELREYTTIPGRMPAMVARFREHALPLFVRHGMDCLFVSVTELGEDCANQLVYALRFDSHEDMVAKWRAFRTDPDWQEAKRQSEAAGPLVSRSSRRLLDEEPFQQLHHMNA